MTWQMTPQGRAWFPPPAPRIVNRGIQGGTFKLDLPDGEWKPVLKLQSKCPDEPSAEGNDHFRTVYCQQLFCEALQAVRDETTIRLGVLLRFSFGIGNGQMKTFYDLCQNGIVHAAITGESLEVDAATVQIFYPENDELPACGLDDPFPILAAVPPSITIGVIQNQSLAMNQIQTPKRMISLATHGDATPKGVPVPPGAQSILLVGDATTVTGAQVFTADGTLAVPFEMNEETPLLAGTWRIDVSSAGGSEMVGVVFGLGV